MTAARDTIRQRLLVLLLLTVLPFVALVVFQGSEERRHASQRARTESRRFVRLMAGDHEQLLAEARQLLFVLARVPAVERGDAGSAGQLFRDVLNQYPQYANIGLAASDGSVVASAHPFDSPPHDLIARQAAATGAFVQGPLRLAPGRTTPSLDLAYGVAGAERKSVIATIELHWLRREAAAAELPEGSSITVWSSDGRILLRYPEPERWVGQRPPDSEVFAAIAASGGEGTAEASGVDGVDRLYGFTRLAGRTKRGDAYLSVGVPEGHAFAELRRTQRRNLLILALAALAAAATSWFAGDRLVVRIVRRLQVLADQDPLTALANRRRLDRVAAREVSRAQRFDRPIAFCLLDIDRFKSVNDRHGHVVGDAVLREVARRIRAAARDSDLVSRYGGEEFAVLLPEATTEMARQVAERVRQAVGATPVTTSAGPVPVTISGGVTGPPADGMDLPSWFASADRALYLAKSNGRDRVEIEKTAA
jgi:diguanylate cyclase (GGDEF)-like protein